MNWLIRIIIAIIILAVQHFLSTRRNVFLGAILPVSYIIYMAYLMLSGLSSKFERDFWFVAIIGTIILLSVWTSGRESIEKKRRKELDKMKARDMR